MAYPTVHVVTLTLDEKNRDIRLKYITHFFQFCNLRRIGLYSIEKPPSIPQILTYLAKTQSLDFFVPQFHCYILKCQLDDRKIEPIGWLVYLSAWLVACYTCYLYHWNVLWLLKPNTRPFSLLHFQLLPQRLRASSGLQINTTTQHWVWGNSRWPKETPRESRVYRTLSYLDSPEEIGKTAPLKPNFIFNVRFRHDG